VHRAWTLVASLRYADALYVAAAERHGIGLLTADARIARSGAPINCGIIIVVP
jgi:predicted nucleic acid-binding protein